MDSLLDIKIHKDKPYVSGKSRHTLNCLAGTDKPITFEVPYGLQIKEAYANGEQINFKETSSSFMEGLYTQIQLPFSFENLVLEVYFEGRPLADGASSSPARIAPDYTNILIYPHLLVSAKQMRIEQKEFFEITVDEDKTFFTPGCSIEEITSKEPGYRTYRAQMLEWMQTLSTPIIIGDFATKAFQFDDIDIEFIYFKTKEPIYDKINIQDKIEEIITFYQGTFGKLVLPEGKPLVIMENTLGSASTMVIGSTCYINESIFSEMFMGGEEDMRLAEGMLAEMLAKYWWDMFSATGVSYLGGSVFSAESICKYYSLLYMESKYGEAYVQQQYVLPMQKEADVIINDFYLNHKGLAHLLPFNFAYTIYLGNTYKQSTTIFDPLIVLEVEQLVGRPVFISTLREIFNTNKGKANNYIFFDDILTRLAISLEDISLYKEMQSLQVEQVYEY